MNLTCLYEVKNEIYVFPASCINLLCLTAMLTRELIDICIRVFIIDGSKKCSLNSDISSDILIKNKLIHFENLKKFV